MPLEVKTISMFFVTHLWILYNTLHEYILHWGIYIHIFCAWVILSQCYHYICVLLVGLFLIYLCMHWYVCVFFKIYSLIPINIRNLVLYLSCDWVILPPCCCYIFLKLMCLCILWKCSQRYVCVLYTNP